MRKIDVINSENIRRSQEQVKAAICYLFKDGKALMIKRKKEPFLGYLVAPGGKFETDETPFQCIQREVYEETGLKINGCSLKVVTSEIGPKNYNWILYIFTSDNFEGDVKESDEGKLCWVNIDSLPDSKMADIDKEILPYVLDENSRYFMKLKYDDNKNCTIQDIMKMDERYYIEDI